MSATDSGPAPDSDYLRLKRQQQTVFVRCLLSNPLSSLKERLSLAVGRVPGDIRLHRTREKGDPPLDESATPNDLNIHNDSELLFVYRLRPEGSEQDPSMDDDDEGLWEAPEAETIDLNNHTS